MDPQTPINQVPDEQLATFGWNLRETQDGHRRQAEVCEQQLQAIRQEFVRRAQLRNEQLQKEVNQKDSEREALLAEIRKTFDEAIGITKKDAPKEEAPKS